MNVDFIDDNLNEVEKKITAACKRCGRDRSDITLIAISKTKPVAMIERCVKNGITHFGENKAQLPSLELYRAPAAQQGQIYRGKCGFDTLCRLGKTCRCHQRTVRQKKYRKRYFNRSKCCDGGE